MACGYARDREPSGTVVPKFSQTRLCKTFDRPLCGLRNLVRLVVAISHIPPSGVARAAPECCCGRIAFFLSLSVSALPGHVHDLALRTGLDPD